MAIRDLLWACPLCGTKGGLRRTRRAERCHACGSRFGRGGGDTIVAHGPGGEVQTRPAAEWLDLLGPLAIEDVTAGPERVRVKRLVAGFRPVRYAGELIGWVERYGEAVEGTVELTPESLRFTLGGDEAEVVPVDDLTAVQPSSTSLQIGSRRSAFSVRFLESSVLLWEARLKEAVRRLWRASGRGEVVEFQPRIESR